MIKEIKLLRPINIRPFENVFFTANVEDDINKDESTRLIYKALQETRCEEIPDIIYVKKNDPHNINSCIDVILEHHSYDYLVIVSFDRNENVYYKISHSIPMPY